VGLLSKVMRFSNPFAAKSRRVRAGAGGRTPRACRFEPMEPRQLLSADPIRLGAYYRDAGNDTDVVPNTIELTWLGGAPGTQLTRVVIDTDKTGDGLTIGDTFFDTAAGGKGVFAHHPFQVVDHTGFTVNATVSDDGTQLILDFTGFDAGEKLVFTIDVDEMGFLKANSVAEGAEFEGSKLTSTFTAPHFQVKTGTDIFLDDYDPKLAGSGLDLPPDSQNPVFTAGAILTLTQTPLPISLAGTVYADGNLNNVQDSGDAGIKGVQLALQEFNGAKYITIATTTTDAQGKYHFDNMLPGTYQVAEVQPGGYFSVGARAGTVNGATRGIVINADTIGQIDLLGGEDTIHNDFSEALPARLSGQVYHDRNNDGTMQAGEPGIGGVTLQVYRVVVSGPAPAPIVVQTDAGGFWSVDGLMPGTYRVVENQPAGYLDGIDTAGTAGGTAVNPGDEINGIFLTSGQSGENYKFGELLPASIRGLVHADLNGDCVLGPGEAPLAGVVIHLFNAQGQVVATTTTDASGQYAFTGLAPGEYRVTEEQPQGYFDGDDHVGSEGGVLVAPDTIAQIVLASGAAGVEYNFCELPPVSIAGNVYVDDNNNGVFDASEVGIGGVTLQLLSSNGTPLGVTTVTDATGAYAFVGLAPGTYGVAEVQPSGYFDGLDTAGSAGGTAHNPGDSITGAILSPGLAAVNYNFGELRPASIQGLVHADRDGDCELDPGEPLLAGVVIQLLSPAGSVLATTTTNAQGVYKFENLAPGTYGIHEVQPAGYFDSGEHAGTAGGVVSANDTITQIVLGSGFAATDYDFCELEPSSIAGRVHADLDGDCELDPGEPLLAGVVIQLLSPTGSVLATTTTNAQGEYKFENLAPGTYGIHEVQPAGYFDSGEHAGSAGGVVSADDTITGIVLGPAVNGVDYDFCELLPASISGLVHADTNGNCVLDPGEVPLAGVVIQLLDAQGNLLATTTTNAAGHYKFDGLAPGTYRVHELQPSGYFDGDDHVGSAGGVLLENDLIADITLGSGQQGLDYNFCEIPPASIEGRVILDANGNCILDPGESPLAGVVIELLDSEGNVIATTTTNSAGVYVFNNLAPGDYGIHEVQPEGIEDGDDHVGSAGGVLADNDLIVAIPLGAGVNAVDYDFCEVATPDTVVRPNIVFPGPFVIPTLQALPQQTPPTFLQPYFPPAAPAPPFTLYYGGGYANGFTWHLSVIDAGRPRANRTAEERVAQLTAGRPDPFTLAKDGFEQSQWELGQDDLNVQRRRLRFGRTNGIPVTGDFNGDGITDVGVFYAGQWFIDLNGNGVWDEGDLWAKLGHDGDLPITGDWDGDGKTDIGIFGRAWPGDPEAVANEPGLPDPNNAPKGVRKNVPPRAEQAAMGWRRMKRTSQGEERADLIDHVFHYGTAGDQPITGDWTGSGVDTIGVFRDGQWLLDVNGDGEWSDGDIEFHMGAHGDRAIVGDFNGDGIDEVGIYRAGKWYIDTNGDHVLDARDRVFELGGPHDLPVVGDWNGDGVDEPGVYHDASAAVKPETAQAPTAHSER
jgi:protocatechuate 3,4-dioxygenase beta subunit